MCHILYFFVCERLCCYLNLDSIIYLLDSSEPCVFFGEKNKQGKCAIMQPAFLFTNFMARVAVHISLGNSDRLIDEITLFGSLSLSSTCEDV